MDVAYQGCGVGEALLEETLALAKQEGYPGVIIFGEPDYYPLRGFVTCDKFGITTANGENFDAFMGYELVPGELEGFGGKFCEPEVFENISPDEVEEYSKKFPVLKKQSFPMQWK